MSKPEVTKNESKKTLDPVCAGTIHVIDYAGDIFARIYVPDGYRLKNVYDIIEEIQDNIEEVEAP